MAKFISHGRAVLHGLPNSEVAVALIKASQTAVPVVPPVTATPVMEAVPVPVMENALLDVLEAPVAPELPATESAVEELRELVVPKVEFKKSKKQKH